MLIFLKLKNMFTINFKSKAYAKRSNLKITLLILNLFMFSNYSFSQSNLSADVKTIELRHITGKELKNMKFDVNKLEKDIKETHNYYVDENENIYFLLKNEEDLFYYLNRIYTDNDIFNKVSREVYYIVYADENVKAKKSEMIQVDLINKKIAR